MQNIKNTCADLSLEIFSSIHARCAAPGQTHQTTALETSRASLLTNCVNTGLVPHCQSDFHSTVSAVSAHYHPPIEYISVPCLY